MLRPRMCGGVVIFAVAAFAGSALAQPPGQSPSPRPQYQQSYAQPGLSPADYEILERGLMPPGKYIAGGVVGSVVGFGVGHMVQGRWTETGWLFTLGEAAAYGGFVYGFINCSLDSYDGDDDCNETLIIGGLIGYGVLRIWEMVDVWRAPSQQNRRYRELQRRTGYQPAPQYGFFIAPAKNRGTVGGLTMRF